MPNTTNSILSADIRAKIDRWLTRYPEDQKRSGVLQALKYAQEENSGWLSERMMDAVADYLQLPRIAVYEVATFYSMYYLQPMGRHVIDVCTNISCALNGANDIADHFKKKLGIQFNETTADGHFTLREVECLGACVAPPVCQVGKKYHENLTPNSVDKMLEELSNGK